VAAGASSKTGATLSLMRIGQARELCAVLNPALLHPRTFAGAKPVTTEVRWKTAGLVGRDSPFLRSVSGLILRRVKTSGWLCCIRTTSGHSHLLLKITHPSTFFYFVRFQKKMRPGSLETPEPDATGYQNLVRQNPKLTRMYGPSHDCKGKAEEREGQSAQMYSSIRAKALSRTKTSCSLPEATP
jgi:hypothetical protein